MKSKVVFCMDTDFKTQIASTVLLACTITSGNYSNYYLHT